MATKLRNIFLFIILISVILSGKTNIVSHQKEQHTHILFL